MKNTEIQVVNMNGRLMLTHKENRYGVRRELIMNGTIRRIKKHMKKGRVQCLNL
jgi:hypothetical protein